MILNDALTAIAGQLDLDAAELIAYADEDYLIGSSSYGTSDDPFRHNLIPYTADGKLLYALVRALKPFAILESGTSHGGSAAHMALALMANKFQSGIEGHLITVDIDVNADLMGVPDDLLRYIYPIRSVSIIDWVRSTNFGGFDFIHEDASHEVDTVYAVYNALPCLMPNGGVIVSHDTNSALRGQIFEGITKAGFEQPPDYVYDESPCGFSVMRYEVSK